MTVPMSSKTCEVTITPLLLFTVEEEPIMATLTCSLKLDPVSFTTCWHISPSGSEVRGVPTGMYSVLRVHGGESWYR